MYADADSPLSVIKRKKKQVKVMKFVTIKVFIFHAGYVFKILPSFSNLYCSFCMIVMTYDVLKFNIYKFFIVYIVICFTANVVHYFNN